MSRAEATKIGPFTGGLNLASDSSAIDNTELAECVNFEVDYDGSLVSRPPIVETVNNSAVWTERIVMIGRGSFAGGTTYVIGSNTDGTYAFDGTTWTLIKAGLKSSVAIQYGDYLWFVPQFGSVEKGGRWSPSSGFVTDANIPYGESALFHKARMFVVPGPNATANDSRVQFTETIDSFTSFTWSASNFIDVAPGDGEKLIDLVIYNDNLVLFKEDSTYLLAYDLRPADAILRVINTQIGASTIRSVASYENSLFVMHEGKVYEVVNYDFNYISLRIPFVYDSTAPSSRIENVFISVVGNRLLVRYFNKIYSYGLKTKAWSEWWSESPLLHNFGPLMEFPENVLTGVPRTYYAGSSILAHENVYAIKETHDATTIEEDLSQAYTIFCTAKTKTLDFDVPFVYKKLMWWGADIYSFRDVEGQVTLIPSGSVDSSIDDRIKVNTTTGRIFVKFLKTLRFRQASFRIILESDGSDAQGPCRLFTLAAIVGMKQVVTKDMN